MDTQPTTAKKKRSGSVNTGTPRVGSEWLNAAGGWGDRLRVLSRRFENSGMEDLEVVGYLELTATEKADLERYEKLVEEKPDKWALPRNTMVDYLAQEIRSFNVDDADIDLIMDLSLPLAIRAARHDPCSRVCARLAAMTVHEHYVIGKLKGGLGGGGADWWMSGVAFPEDKAILTRECPYDPQRLGNSTLKPYELKRVKETGIVDDEGKFNRNIISLAGDITRPPLIASRLLGGLLRNKVKKGDAIVCIEYGFMAPGQILSRCLRGVRVHTLSYLYGLGDLRMLHNTKPAAVILNLPSTKQWDVVGRLLLVEAPPTLRELEERKNTKLDDPFWHVPEYVKTALEYVRKRGTILVLLGDLSLHHQAARLIDETNRLSPWNGAMRRDTVKNPLWIRSAPGYTPKTPYGLLPPPTDRLMSMWRATW